jgi:hypothetical protein
MGQLQSDSRSRARGISSNNFKVAEAVPHAVDVEDVNE